MEYGIWGGAKYKVAVVLVVSISNKSTTELVTELVHWGADVGDEDEEWLDSELVLGVAEGVAEGIGDGVETVTVP